MQYPELAAAPLSPDAPVINGEGAPSATVLDFWQWAHSDIVGNA